MSTISATTWILVTVFATIAISTIAAWKVFQPCRTERSRAQVGTEYARELLRTPYQNRGEEALEDHWKKQIQNLHIRPLTRRDRSCFIESWRMVQAQFVDNPSGALAGADQLLEEVMSKRGYRTADADFEQRVADISVEYPNAVEHYLTAHAIALLHARGGASTEDLRQATIHYRLLFEALISEPVEVRSRMAS